MMDLAVMGLQLDFMIFKVFSNQKDSDSMIPRRKQLNQLTKDVNWHESTSSMV